MQTCSIIIASDCAFSYTDPCHSFFLYIKLKPSYTLTTIYRTKNDIPLTAHKVSSLLTRREKVIKEIKRNQKMKQTICRPVIWSNGENSLKKYAQALLWTPTIYSFRTFIPQGMFFDRDKCWERSLVLPSLNLDDTKTRLEVSNWRTFCFRSNRRPIRLEIRESCFLPNNP